MLRLIKKVFTALFGSIRYLVTKSVSLNIEPCMRRPTLIYLKPLKLNYYPFMISLEKCNGSCNVVDDL